MQTATATTVPLTTTFAYDSSGSGELAQMTTPYGGHLRWAYVSLTLSGSRVFREVQDRYISMSSGAAETHVALYHDAGDNNRAVHMYGTLVDFSGGSNKSWWFQTDMSQLNAGLMQVYDEKSFPGSIVLIHQDFTWSQTPTSLNPYISSTLTTLDPGQTYAAAKKTNQTLDQYGNLTQQQIFDFGNLSTPVRTYTNVFLNDNCGYPNHICGSNYAARYIFNRLMTSTVTDGTKTTTLANNYYDFNTLTDRPGITQHDAAYTTSNLFRGNVSSSSTPAGSTSASYDIGGNPTGSTSNGVTTSVTTNSSTNYAAPSAITTNSLTTNMSWSSFFGPSSTTGPNGDSMSINYSAARPTSTTAPTGAVTTFTYGDAYTPPYKTATTNGHWVKTSMDGFGRTIKIESGDASTTKSVVDTVYAPCGCSPLGKLTQSSRPHTPAGTVYWTVNTYDASGRTTRVTLPDGSHTDYAYQGNTVTVTDPAGKWKKFTLDALGNLTIVQEPDPTFGTVSTNYTYDILNHLTNVSMPRGANTQTRTFVYNTGNTVGAFLLSATNPETGTVNYTYSNSLLATKTDAKGQQLTYQYDTYHRLTSVTWTNSPNGSQVLRTYYYDSNPFVGGFSQYAAGRLAAVQYATLGMNQNGTKQINLVDMYSYTQAGLPAIKRLQVNQDLSWQDQFGFGHGTTLTSNLDASYQYNNEGKVTSVTYPTSGSGTGSTYNYTYDSMYRLYGMTDASAGAVVNSVTYGPANEMASMSFYMGPWFTTETRTYNTLGQMTNLAVTGQNNISTQYTYPTGANNGKISSRKINATGEEVQYAYDSLNRLISGITTAASDSSGNTPWGQNYGYDGFGNLTAKTVSKGSAPTMSVSVSPATNRITSVFNLTYDANGNVTNTGIAAGNAWLGYDAENRMISVDNAGTMRYGYDAQNKRIWSWDGATFDMYGNVTAYKIYFYSPSGQKLATYQMDEVISGPPSWIASLQSTLLTSDKYFGGRRIQIEDRLSSTNGKFYPYGEDKPGNPASDTWKFATYWRDSQTNLDYADQRYFSSQYGSFTTPDPYKASSGPGDPASWNQYTYTRGDPFNRYDPSGLEDETPPKNPCEAHPNDCAPPVNLNPESHPGNPECANSKKGCVDPTPPPPHPPTYCEWIPDGRALGVNVSLTGLVGGLSGSLELVINYNTGAISGFAAGGLQLSLPGASVTGLTAFIWQLGPSNSNYSGPFSTAQISFGPVTVFASGSSGGATAPATVDMAKPFLVGMGVQVGTGAAAPVSLAVSTTYYSDPKDFGNISDLAWRLLFPDDYQLYSNRQKRCK